MLRWMLWFAFILLSLSYWKQHLSISDWEISVVICFHFTIFVVLETTGRQHAIPSSLLWFAFILLSLSYWKQRGSIIVILTGCCDLLSFYYLCRTGNNITVLGSANWPVVICFHFTIFVVLETTQLPKTPVINPLWFAFILLSLSYWKQQGAFATNTLAGCDLLSFYYLCRTGNNFNLYNLNGRIVVICFHFTIFVVLETT